MMEKNILAYFKTPEAAEEAVKDLQQLGVIDAQIDRIKAYPGDGIDQYMNPLTGKTGSLTGLSLGLDEAGPDVRVLLAADSSASGMSDGTGDGDEMVTGRDILLTAVVDESSHQEALSLIKARGGLV